MASTMGAGGGGAPAQASNASPAGSVGTHDRHGRAEQQPARRPRRRAARPRRSSRRPRRSRIPAPLRAAALEAVDRRDDERLPERLTQPLGRRSRSSASGATSTTASHARAVGRRRRSVRVGPPPPSPPQAPRAIARANATTVERPLTASRSSCSTRTGAAGRGTRPSPRSHRRRPAGAAAPRRHPARSPTAPWWSRPRRRRAPG